MARRRSKQEHENHERWLVSYADFITLLFAFFVVMFASSQTDKAKARQVSQAVAKAFSEGATIGAAPLVAKVLGGTVDDTGQGNAMMKGPGGAQRSTKDPPPDAVVELLPSLTLLSASLEEEIRTGKVEISLEPRGLVISLRHSVLFPSGTDYIDPASYPIVEKLAQVVADLPNPVRLEGHTDSLPIRTARFRSNWDLSAARSIAMLELLADRYKVPRERMAIAGYAETHAVDSNESEDGRARNRRVDVVILHQIHLKASDRAAGTVRPGPKHK